MELASVCSKVVETLAMSCTDGWMYLMKAEDFHLPIALIVESGRPTCAAVVAAPMRKLWPLKRETSRPAEESVARSEATSASLDRGMPDCRRNSGPGVAGRTAK